MATKRIQLRGISRNPSDRMTEDGGVAESMNVFLDNDEIAPVITPNDVTTDLGLPKNLLADRIFVHKTANYEHIITQEDEYVYAYVNGEKQEILYEEGLILNDINSIGNTIIVATDQSVHYALWKGEEYKYIGNQIPVPIIQFETLGNDDETFQGKNSGVLYLDTSGEVTGRMSIATFDKEAWEQAARDVHETEETNAYLSQVRTELWAEIQKLKTKIGNWGYFTCPRLARYAIQLYDGSYVYHSVPILIGPGYEKWISVRGGSADSSATGDALYGAIYYTINLYYKAIAKLIKWDVQGWEDIITGVDIFISTDIAYPQINEEFASCEDGGGEIYFKGYNRPFELTKKEILSKGNFYKIKSIAVRDLNGLKDGIDLHEDAEVENTETLATKERLTSDYMTSHKVIPASMDVFNNSLLINASKIELPDAYPLLNGVFCNANIAYSDDKVNHQEEKQYRFRFYIRRTDGEEYVVMAKNPEGGLYLKTPFVTNNLPSVLNKSYYADPMAWIAYPDVNCYRVDVDFGGGDVATFEMSQHPLLSCSYAFVGMATYLSEAQIAGDGVLDEYEKKTYSVNNQIMISQTNNPFIFPAGGRFTLQSKVLGIAMATTALSQGQFGQFPLYVFTEDGIWAMETAADGTFVTSKPLSRDVCTNPDSIVSIDQAVVFVTDKGVMLLQGSQFTKLSAFMNGRHYVIEPTAETIIQNQDGFCDLVPAISDTASFIAFVKKARVAYDYTGRRLIFIREDLSYQYVYKLDTQTWHKISLGLTSPTNSYPECLAWETKTAERQFLKVIENVTEVPEEEHIPIIMAAIPGITEEDASHFLRMSADLDITDCSEGTITQLGRALDYDGVDTKQFTKEVTVTRIYNLSTALDASEPRTTEKGIIATRPFDLGEPDVFKTITDARVRGHFARGAVKFILMGSNDGVNFYTINTLRGKSWKMFRMIILADLAMNERISWIDIQYETRFTNKLR